MKRKLMGMMVFCFAATFLSAAQEVSAAQEEGKVALESFKRYLVVAQIKWDCTVSEVKEVKTANMQDIEIIQKDLEIEIKIKKNEYDSIPRKLVKAKKIAQSILKGLKARQDKLVKTEVPPELDRETDALLAQSRSFGEVLNSYIEQDVRAATGKTLDDIRRNADDHISDSDRTWSPVAISLLPSVQWPRAEADVTGLRLNMFAGKHHNVYGVDIAIISNVVSDCAAGIQLAGFGNASDTAYGFQMAAGANYANELVGGAQIALLGNINKCYGSWLQVGGLVNSSGFFAGAQIAGIGNGAYSCKGLQIGGLGNKADGLSGFQIGGLGNKADNLSGFQIGYVNDARELSGFQIGALNDAKGMTGVQIGVVNCAEQANGLQVGVFNYIGDATCSFLPLLNMHF